MSSVMKGMCESLNIKQLYTSVYHPQTDGLVKRFNFTLKSMLKKFLSSEICKWNQLVPPLLLTMWDAPQSLLEFLPFELLYGQQPQGLLDLVKDRREEQAVLAKKPVQYKGQLRERD